MLHAHQCTHALLLDVRKTLLEFVREPKCYDWKSRIVVGTSLGAKDGSFCAFEGMFPLFAMDVANTDIPSTGLNGLTQKSCISQAVLHDCSETIESKVNEVIILCDDLRTWTGEV